MEADDFGLFPERTRVYGNFAMAQTVTDKQEYIAKIKLAVQQKCQCEATHRRSVSVNEKFKGKTLWKGDVEVFWLTGNPKAKRCYAWARGSGDEAKDFEIILEVPPVIGAATAVRAALLWRQNPGS